MVGPEEDQITHLMWHMCGTRSCTLVLDYWAAVDPATGSPRDGDASMIRRRLKVFAFRVRMPRPEHSIEFCARCPLTPRTTPREWGNDLCVARPSRIDTLETAEPQNEVDFGYRVVQKKRPTYQNSNTQHSTPLHPHLNVDCPEGVQGVLQKKRPKIPESPSVPLPDQH